MKTNPPLWVFIITTTILWEDLVFNPTPLKINDWNPQSHFQVFLKIIQSHEGLLQMDFPRSPTKNTTQVVIFRFLAVHFPLGNDSGRLKYPRGPWSRRKIGLTSRNNDVRPIANDARHGWNDPMVKGVTLNGPFRSYLEYVTYVYIYILKEDLLVFVFWVARSNRKLVEALIYQKWCTLAVISMIFY